MSGDTPSFYRSETFKHRDLIVLLLPDQQHYVKDCLARGEVSSDGIVGNPHHAIDDFPLNYLLEVARKIGGVEKEAAFEEVGNYSFLLVLKKASLSDADSAKIFELEKKVQEAWQENDTLKKELLQKERPLCH